MNSLTDSKLITELNKSGYTIAQNEHQLIIRRKFKIALFFWAYIILFSLYLTRTTPNPINVSLGLAILLISMLVYYHNTIRYMLIDVKASSLAYKKGLLPLLRYANFSEVKTLELKTYDVPSSASPFKKSNRDYIAEIRLIMDKGLPLDLISIEKDAPEDLTFTTTVFEAVSSYAGFTRKITRHK